MTVNTRSITSMHIRIGILLNADVGTENIIAGNVSACHTTFLLTFGLKASPREVGPDNDQGLVALKFIYNGLCSACRDVGPSRRKPKIPIQIWRHWRVQRRFSHLLKLLTMTRSRGLRKISDSNTFL